MPTVVVSTMGGFALSIAGCTRLPPATRHARALLACLAIDAGRAFSRDELIEKFWPDIDPARGRANLATALWSVRRAFAEDAPALLRATRTEVTLLGEVSVDVVAFERELALPQTDARSAGLRRYRGDFLPGHSDVWSAAQRERIGMIYETALARVVRETGDPEFAWALLDRNAFADEAYEILIDRALQSQNRVSAGVLIARWREAYEQLGSAPQSAFLERERALAAAGSASGAPIVEGPSDESVAAERSIRAHLESGAREAAIDQYQRYHRAAHARGVEPHADVVAAFHEALWSRPVAAPLARPFPLPQHATRFIGREPDVQAVCACVRPGAITTVLGPAGVGKTRTAIRVAELLAPRFVAGVRYIEVAGHTSATLDAAIGTLAASVIGEETAILVIDNVEHVAADVARIVCDVAARRPQLAFLLTSRARVDVVGPSVALAPLDLPLAVDAPRLFAHSPAVRFFAERAVAARSGFTLDIETLTQVTELCRLLDGIPLALELAAAQLRYIMPRELLQRFASHPEHHGDTLLRDQIAESFALLEKSDRELAYHLTVFDRRFTIDEAESIGGRAVLDAIVRLVNLSLIQVEESSGETVYRFLETTYRYARERLEHAGDREKYELRAIRAMRDALIGRLGIVGGELTASDVAYLRVRVPNVLRALDVWCVLDPLGALEIALATKRFWTDEGLHDEAIDRLERLAASLPALSSELRYAVKRALGAEQIKRQDLANGLQALRDALAIVEESGDREAIRDCIMELAVAAYERADYAEARSLLVRAVDMATPQSEPWGQVHSYLANVAIAVGDFPEAERNFGIIEGFPRAPTRQANYLRNRAYAAALAGERDRASVLAEAALAVANDPAVGAPHRASVFAAVGFVRTQAGDPLDGLRWFARGVIELANTSAAMHVMYTVEDAACALGALDRHEDAVSLLAAVSLARERVGAPVDPSAQALLTATLTRARARLDPAVFRRAELRGRLLDVPTASERLLAIVAELADQPELLPGLSERESSIARLIASGATNAAIGDRLAISVKTVENHVGTIFRKLQMTRRAQVAAYVSQRAFTS